MEQRHLRIRQRVDVGQLILKLGRLATHSNGIGHVKGYLKAGRGIRFTEDTPAACWEADPHNLGKPLSTISTLKTR